MTAAVVGEVVEGPGEIAGAGDVRTGEADLEETSLVTAWELVAGTHDPCGDLARARDIGADRLGGASPQGGKVLADGQRVPLVAEFTQPDQGLGCGNAATGGGEQGGGVRAERGEDAGGSAVAGGGEQGVEE
ncbi:hypothetical protein [Streptomyces alboflavus]|uniref:hypothetical protein n=1 Tax=Streptomyces alboflavus TaxID=67267 RepID=UPI00368357D8